MEYTNNTPEPQANFPNNTPEPQAIFPNNKPAPVPAKKKHIVLSIWSAIYPLLGFILLQIIISLIFVIILLIVSAVQIIPAGGSIPDVLTQVNVTMTTNGILILLPTLVVDLIVLRLASFLDSLDIERYPRTPVRHIRAQDYLVAILLGVFANFLISAILSGFRLEQYFPVYTDLIESITMAPLWMQLITVGIVAPIAEEYLMRALVLSRLRRFMPVWAAILIQAILFGVIHMNVLQGIYAAVLGILLGYLYVKYNSLATCIVMHIVINSMSTLLPSEFGADWNPAVLGIVSALVVAACLVFLIKQKQRFLVQNEGTDEAAVVRVDD